MVMIVYDDPQAGRRAMIVLDEVFRKAVRKKRLVPQLWRFDLLEIPGGRAAATAAGSRASLLIVAAVSKAALPAAVQHWVHDWIGQSRRTPAAVAALLGPADDPDAPDSPRVTLLRSAAETAGLSFFAPAPPLEPSCQFPAPAKPTTNPPTAHASRRILLVEDESIIRQCSTQALTGAGYHVDAVEEGQAGWEALQARSYDLLITDNRMAGLSGSELILKLRSAQMTLPVILASGNIVPEHAAVGSRLQPVSALPKPFSSDQLLALVAEVLRPAGHVPDGPGVTLRVTQESYLHWGLNE